MRCLQAMLWVHFYRLGEYATDPFRRHASIRLVLQEALLLSMATDSKCQPYQAKST